MIEDKQLDNKKIHYLVYKTTNTVNGMIYIGKHQTADVNDLYLGSGTVLRKAIMKYGAASFKKEILFDFDTEKEMLDKERELVNEEFVKRRDTYNCVVGGQGLYTKQHGNNGTNQTLRNLNIAEKIYICNPYTMQKKKLFFTKELPQDYIDAGWEYGTLSKYNMTWLMFNGQKVTIARFAMMNNLNKALAFERFSNGWSAEEMINIPEHLKLFKSEEEKTAYCTLKKQQTSEKIKSALAAKSEMRKKLAQEKNSMLARQWYDEYIEVGKDQFLNNHPELSIRKIQSYFRKYIAEYIPRKRQCKTWSVEYNGKTQSLTKWCKELNINKRKVYKMLNSGNMSEAEILDFMTSTKSTSRK